jgi:hypothetical protein
LRRKINLTAACVEGEMTAISEPFAPAAKSVSPRFAEWARWVVLGIAFVVSGIVLGCVAALRSAPFS